MVTELASLLTSIEGRLATPGHVITGDESDFYSLLGLVYQQIGNFPGAEKCHAKAVSENNYNLRSQQALSNLASRKSDWEADDHAAAQAEKIDSRHVQTRLIANRVLIRNGSFDKAVSHLEETLRSHPRHPAVWNEYAKVLQQADRIKEALDAQVQAIQHCGDNPSYKHQLGLYYSQLSQLLASSGGIEESVRANLKSYLLPKQNPAERYLSPLRTLRALDRRISA